MSSILSSIETPYVDAQTLLSLLPSYRKPREAILRMVKNGELIRLKNGFYLIADKIKQGSGKSIPYEQVANMLYGPSYVSLEWALSFYGMIPEGVRAVTCMALGRDKEFHTPVGNFVYCRLSADRYAVGVTKIESNEAGGGFLMATPEKALSDVVFRSCKHMNQNQLKIELVESKRMDEEVLRRLNKPLLEQIAGAYRSKSVDTLLDVVGKI